MLQQQIAIIVAQEPTERSGDLVVSHGHARLCLDDLGLWIIEAADSLEADNV